MRTTLGCFQSLRFGIGASALALAATIAGGASAALAASLSAINHGSNIYSVYLDGEAENGQFDTVYALFKPAGASLFDRNNDFGEGAPRPPGQPATYFNRLLASDPLDFPGGLGWAVLGLTKLENELSFAGSPLGQRIDTSGQPHGDLFLANLYLKTDDPSGKVGATAYVQLIRAGILVQELSLAIPEPATAWLAIVGLGAMLGRRAGWRQTQCGR